MERLWVFVNLLMVEVARIINAVLTFKVGDRIQFEAVVVRINVGGEERSISAVKNMDEEPRCVVRFLP